mgnify:CR=1 FL=1|jgi:hypothetical protein
MTLAKDEHSLSAEEMAHDNKGKLTTDAIAGAGKHDEEGGLTEEARSSRTQERRAGNGAALEPLFDDSVDRDFRDRWREVQTGFVDEPRQAVEQADVLVAELMQRLAQSFSEQRNNLESQWDASDKVSTEELRIALTRYRSFFERLLSI